jgi:hypothetical protein
LRDRLPDRAFDVTLTQIASALELLVQTLQDTARLLTSSTRTLHGHVIAALFRDNAEAPLNQREVLAVLAEQD